jgi:bifunctional DNA primase/polymerase-like protein
VTAPVRTDREITLAAVCARRWSVVKLVTEGKKPIGEHWETTTDADQVATWLDARHNIGLVCHQQTGVAVLDPDKPQWTDMIDTLGQPGLPWVITGSGKLHYYIAWTPNLPAKLTWQGQDTGLRYQWITAALMPKILCEPIDPVTDNAVRLCLRRSTRCSTVQPCRSASSARSAASGACRWCPARPTVTTIIRIGWSAAARTTAAPPGSPTRRSAWTL